MQNKLEFKPQNSIYFIDKIDNCSLTTEDISIDVVGEKAYGLSCLPKAWTLPYVVLSKSFLNDYRNLNGDQQNYSFFLQNWIENIQKALKLNLDTKGPLIIRSSSSEEGLDERGKLHSKSFSIKNLDSDLQSFLKLLADDTDLENLSIPLIIQNFIPDEKEKGHLSNERRLYKDTRDWVGEIENSALEDKVFKINLRNWREKIDLNNFVNKPLICNSRLQVKNILKIAAHWAYSIQHLRIHFEWVYDGNNIYIVQADEAKSLDGINPHKMYDHLKTQKNAIFNPSIIKKISIEHAKKYPKIHNVFLYQKLNLPIANLYILDNQEYINQLKCNDFPNELENDISSLFQGNFIIRMDVDTDDQKTRQMLPRDNFNNSREAIDWLIEQSKKLPTTQELKFVFILHGFIPAISSAFAYAAPGERKVQIESLWGLPEGLYYNSHDKYIVDTGSCDIKAMDLTRFNIHKKVKYKGFCVIPTENGEWNAEKVKAPYDWKESIEKEEWVLKIAHDSRLIAEEEGKAQSVMWFVDVQQGTDTNTELFPWHHEDYNIQLLSETTQNRKKTLFDKVFLIENNKDIVDLKKELALNTKSIQFVKIQPTDSELLRNKELLNEIGVITQKLNATIILEGGVLSHAFYQLMKTGASIEILLPFNDTNETLVFNKLVRDKIPHNIEEGGESPQIVKLSKQSKLLALKEKLIEEAFEVKDADDVDVLSELADVKEVFDQILIELNISKTELSENQSEKRNKAGGFAEGYVLTKTQNLIPGDKVDSSTDGQLFEEIELEESIPEVDYNLIDNKKITRYEDQRKQGSSRERILRIDSPILNQEWVIKSKEITLPSYPKEKFVLNISSLREGINNRIELSLTTEKNGQLDLDLFDD